MKLGIIVEGHGETEAVPVLLRRLASAIAPSLHLEIANPYRLPKGKMRKAAELRRAVELLSRKTSPDGKILVVVDADDDCPVALASELRELIEPFRAEHVRVVVAVREYESWLIAGCASLRAECGLPSELAFAGDVEALRDAKGWFDDRMRHGYRETVDQKKLTARFDLTSAAAVSASFDKFRRVVIELFDGA